MDAIFERTSIREYADQPVEEEKVEKLLRAAMAAPSAGNQQPWEFIIVTDDGLREELSHTSPYTKPVSKAPLSLVLLGNQEGLRFEENWEQDMGAAAENILLEATDLGLGAVWQGVAPVPERVEHIRTLFKLPESIQPFCIISIGYPVKRQATQEDRFDPSRIHRNAY